MCPSYIYIRVSENRVLAPSPPILRRRKGAKPAAARAELVESRGSKSSALPSAEAG
jgi:hypothetical protein